MITIRITAELVEQLLTTGYVQEKVEIVDGIPPGHHLVGAHFKHEVLTLEFEDTWYVRTDKAITVRSFKPEVNPAR